MARLIHLISVIINFQVIYLSASNLNLVNNACFERVAIGKRLNNSDISRTLTARTNRQCDMECERDMCNAYSFGIDMAGNATCEIGLHIPENAYIEDANYDLFVKLAQCRNTTRCFRRVVTGRRLIDRYVRKALPCDSLGNCEIACSIEKSFFCEGFNFRFDPSGQGRSSCQLTAIPVERLDLTIDFDSDLDYDFFERDRNAPPGCEHWSGMGYGYPVLTLGLTPNNYQPPLPKQHWHNKDPYPTKSPPYQGSVGSWNNYNYNQISGGGPSKVDTGDKKIYSVYYGGSSTPIAPTTSVAQPDECFVRSQSGFRLDKRIAVISLSAPTLYDCEYACANEKKFQCNIFSYRYSASATLDNCNLGERNIRVINPYYDILPDRDCDIYQRNEYAVSGCQPRKAYDSDCFERVRSGLRLNGAMVQFSINTESLHECELICLHIRHFTCRAFSFRYGSPTIGSPSDSCLLSDWPITEMDPRKHFVEDPSVELYHRGSYGHGCELGKLPNGRTPFYGGSPTIVPQPIGPTYIPPPPSSTFIPPTSPTRPYQPANYYPPIEQPLPPKPTTYVPPTHPPPLPPSYPPSRPPSLQPRPGSYPLPPVYGSGGGQTYLPPVEYKPPIGRHPLPPVYGSGGTNSYLPPNDYRTPSVRPPPPRATDKICYLGYGAPARLTIKAVRSSLLVPTELECKAECTRAREGSHFRCATLSYRSGNCELSDIELRDLRPEIDYRRDDHYWLFSWDFADARCYVPPAGTPVMPPGGGGFTFQDLGGSSDTWMRYTVSGRPCKWGTYCTQSLDVGVWTCPVENGDWDYCCRSGHHCGYSEGYSYPWCYVGKHKEQWRPCSEHYYPYGENKQSNWPVSYLHRENPPVNQSYTQHQPSLVDRFLNTFRSQSARKMGLFDETSPVQKSNESSTSAQILAETSTFSTRTSDLPNFSVVDLKPTNQTETKI